MLSQIALNTENKTLIQKKNTETAKNREAL
jgi:hypothetical protein